MKDWLKALVVSGICSTAQVGILYSLRLFDGVAADYWPDMWFSSAMSAYFAIRVVRAAL